MIVWRWLSSVVEIVITVVFPVRFAKFDGLIVTMWGCVALPLMS